MLFSLMALTWLVAGSQVVVIVSFLCECRMSLLVESTGAWQISLFHTWAKFIFELRSVLMVNDFFPGAKS